MKHYGLIGRSLKHSFSKDYFTDMFDALDIDAVYHNLELDDISQVKTVVSEYSLVGFNVTIPYKESILPFLDAMSPEAEAIGAVNVVKITDKGWVGHNTDHAGFIQSFAALITNGQKALILGTGGASKAIAYALTQKGIPFLKVSRSKGDLNYTDLTAAHIASHQIIINCTPLGTLGQTEQFPDIPYDGVGPGHLAYDLVYNPPETTFLERCKAQGAMTMNGLKMLQIQAELSYAIWQED